MDGGMTMDDKPKCYMQNEVNGHCDTCEFKAPCDVPACFGEWQETYKCHACVSEFVCMTETFTAPDCYGEGAGDELVCKNCKWRTECNV